MSRRMSDHSVRPVVILGSGRHGRNIADTFRQAGQEILGFLDDTKPKGTRVNDVAVLGGFDLAGDADLLRRAALHVAIGNSFVRKRLYEELAARGAVLASAIHPSTVISPYAHLAPGLFVAPFVRIAAARIGVGCSIDPFCSVGGESELGPYVTLAAHCSLVAASRIGACCFLGTHTSVGGGSIGEGCIIGAGSVVLRDLPDDVRAYGAPAKIVGPADWSRPPV
jgi:sugar O-acyltransferase (sialic acid O-acetyltransferase NeuD family)